ncbi:MAG: UDP-N-acetylmuramoyl-L-alanine--D-glutamate ligase [Gammaproteobacteria bacterium]|nr:MAG: UDP-N-acetylmuramoyl-L-alanine--D-glutamate ligase [Gammaproteobacteria bacterium]
MSLSAQLQNKQIVILGVGITGLACVRFLHQQGLSFTVNDSRANAIDSAKFQQDYPNVQLILGDWNVEVLKQAHVIIASPGIDLNSTAIAPHISENCQVWGDVELFFQVINDLQISVPTLAVTGSNGKSTVVSLLAHIAEKSDLNIALAGNIGKPIMDLLADVNAIAALDCLILELSSFQLETLHSMKACGATILNVSDDHLDRHKTLANYQKIKQSIYQQACTIVVNRDDKLTQPLSNVNEQVLDTKQQTVSFGSNKPLAGQFGLVEINRQLHLSQGEKSLIKVTDLPLAGIHNALNCLAALALGQSAGWQLNAMVNALASFTGLAHRCQHVATNDGVLWINDSKATNVGATLAAIEGLAKTKTKQQQFILIAGGEGKGADFSPLQPAIAQSVDLLITLGKDGDKIALLSNKNKQVNSLEQAVDLASEQVKQGDIVLLSPACASLDMFKNFAQRGDVFMQAVQQLPQRRLAHE